MPFFSVIMPAYNREKYIGDALGSVLAQSCADWECIVVDDGSADSTCAIVREFVAKEPRIRLIERANGGPGAARNQGATEARGKYLAFLDSDDLWMHCTLETEVKHWTQEPLRADVFPDAIDACDHGAVSAGVGMTAVLADAFRRAGGF